jgi:hypothetical protein
MLENSPNWATQNDLAYWFVELSDGKILYQGDEREKSSWVDLAEYLEKEPNLYIKRLALQFRYHIEEVCGESPYYYFAKSCIGSFSGSKGCVVCGYYQDDKIICITYAVPELIIINKELRDISSCQSPFLIYVKKLQ